MQQEVNWSFLLLFVFWVFNKEGVACMASLNDISMNITTLKDGENLEMYEMSQKSSYESHKTLVMECPSGDYKDEFDDQSKRNHSSPCNSKTLTAQSAHSLLYLIYSEHDYSKAIGTVTQQFLCKMGYSNCTPSAVENTGKPIKQRNRSAGPGQKSSCRRSKQGCLSP